jgi:release factor glutamine methyltransferase
MPPPADAPQPTLLAILNKTSDYFKGKGIENHRLDAQLLLGHVLGMRRLDLYMNFDRPMDEGELARYRELVKRRAAREPLQHLLGEVPFREITLKVDRRALIPRQETELIVDLVRKAVPAGVAAEVLDVGVGAGPIYLSLLKELPQLRVSGVDLAETCVLLTRENAERNGLQAADLRVGDAFAPFPPERRWDVIVSNPPYVGERELPGLAPEVRDHDPRSALVGGPEGWEFPARLMELAHARLNDGGTLILEIGAGQAEVLKGKAASRPWVSCRHSLDYSGVERFLILSK